MSHLAPIVLDVPEAFEGLWGSTALKTMRGGRGGAKSWEVARYLVIRARSGFERILCAREFQTSIADSVHKLLVDTAERMGVLNEFKVNDTSITHWATGSEFLFKGLRRNIREIKSTEGITITWVEEGQSVSDYSWEILLPTVFRTKGAQLIITYNPENELDPVDKRFWQGRATYGEDAWAIHVNFDDNPNFPEDLERQRRHAYELAKKTGDFDAYNHVWLGDYRKVSDAQIFKGRYRVESFTAPVGTRFYYGMDFGFANDPSALIRCWIGKDAEGRETLYIDQEAFGYGVELDELPQLMRSVPGSTDWPIKADGSRPETISHLKRRQFNISDAKKWPGSVEDGIAHLKGFAGGIVIHERCKNMIQEAAQYSFKIDPNQLDENGKPVVLPIIVDAWNHGWDAVRYALDGYIQRRGAAGVWERLGGKQ